MEWKGRELRGVADYVHAMGRIHDRSEADEFAVRFQAEHRNAERDLGYLTGYMPRPEGARVRELFGVQHPILGELAEEEPTYVELLVLGMEFMSGQLAGDDFDTAARKAREAVQAMRLEQA